MTPTAIQMLVVVSRDFILAKVGSDDARVAENLQRVIFAITRNALLLYFANMATSPKQRNMSSDCGAISGQHGQE